MSRSPSASLNGRSIDRHRPDNSLPSLVSAVSRRNSPKRSEPRLPCAAPGSASSVRNDSTRHDERCDAIRPTLSSRRIEKLVRSGAEEQRADEHRRCAFQRARPALRIERAGCSDHECAPGGSVDGDLRLRGSREALQVARGLGFEAGTAMRDDPWVKAPSDRNNLATDAPNVARSSDRARRAARRPAG